LTLSRKPKDERLKSSMECRTCQKGKPHEGAR
jgi:hypothetical protein